MLLIVELMGLGVLVGFAGATLGAGGGFILVPILFSLLGWPIIAAVATSHFCGLAVSASASGTYAAAGLIDWELGVIMGAATVAGSATGASLARWISTPVVAVLFCLVAILSAVRMWLPQGETGDGSSARSGAGFWVALPIMYFVGMAAAILGLGGGVLIVPILTTLLKQPTRRAVATSVFMVGINAAAAGAVYYGQGNVPVVPAGVLAATVFAGALVGSSLQHRLPVMLLRRAFAVLLFVLSIRLLFKALES